MQTKKKSEPSNLVFLPESEAVDVLLASTLKIPGPGRLAASPGSAATILLQQNEGTGFQGISRAKYGVPELSVHHSNKQDHMGYASLLIIHLKSFLSMSLERGHAHTASLKP